jgi:hypothetical protein
VLALHRSHLLFFAMMKFHGFIDLMMQALPAKAVCKRPAQADQEASCNGM